MLVANIKKKEKPLKHQRRLGLVYTLMSYFREWLSKVIGKPRIFCSSRPLLAVDLYANFKNTHHTLLSKEENQQCSDFDK